jgi:hypothetical protein
MNDTPRRQRRSPLVVILDAMLNLVAAVHTGPTPRPRVRGAGSAGRNRAGRVLLVAGVLAAVGGTVLLIAAFVRTPDGLALRPDPAAAPVAPSSRSVAPSVTGSPSAARTTASSPGPTTPPARSRATSPAASGGSDQEAAVVPLTARYTAASYAAGLLGYRATVTVTNPGPRARDGWLLIVTLPRTSLAVSVVSGATAARNGRVWTFTPTSSTVRIPPGGSVQVVYEVRGATLVDAAPDDCRVDGNRCTD